MKIYYKSKKNKNIYLRNIIMISLVAAGCTLSGCTKDSKIKVEKIATVSDAVLEEAVEEKEADISDCIIEIYKSAEAENSLDSLDTISNIVAALGEEGYAAVDCNNQVDMTNADRVQQFIAAVSDSESDSVDIISVAYDGGFVLYSLETDNGEVVVNRYRYLYQNGIIDCTDMTAYSAYEWSYSDDGYLFFEQYYMNGFDGASEEVTLRVKPLSEECRELNRKYILPIGYSLNNLFITEWNEEQSGEINFYDMFEKLYPLVMKQELPYKANSDNSIGETYYIDREEFESVITSYFNISSESLMSYTTYMPDEEKYRYRPRGLQDAEQPNVPFPEVVDYTENSDGTITLTVNAVYPNKLNACFMQHEVTVRPFSNGAFQYVSNHIISAEDRTFPWHEERLDDEEWEEIYGVEVEE